MLAQSKGGWVNPFPLPRNHKTSNSKRTALLTVESYGNYDIPQFPQSQKSASNPSPLVLREVRFAPLSPDARANSTPPTKGGTAQLPRACKGRFTHLLLRTDDEECEEVTDALATLIVAVTR